MSGSPNNCRAAGFSCWVYSRLLAVYPRTHRDEFGRSMAQLFRDQCRDAYRDAGAFGLTLLWLRVLPDIIKSAALEYLILWRGKLAGWGTHVPADRRNPKIVFVAASLMAFGLFLSAGAISAWWLKPDQYASSASIYCLHYPNSDDVSATKKEMIGVVKSPEVLDEVVDTLKLASVLGGEGDPAQVRLKAREELKKRISIQETWHYGSPTFDIWAFSGDPKQATLIARKTLDVCARKHLGWAPDLFGSYVPAASSSDWPLMAVYSVIIGSIAAGGMEVARKRAAGRSAVAG